MSVHWEEPGHAYGNTETFTLTTGLPANSPEEVHKGSSGEVLPGNTFKIVDPLTGDIVPRGEEGEICVKGPTLMLQYIGIPLDETLDADGFLRTGDGGYFDDDGLLFWKGRITDIIKTGGANVSPREVDETLATYPGVKVTQTVGVPHETLGEMVVSCVVPHEGETLDADKIRAFMKERLASYKVPRHVLFFDEADIELTGSAKIKSRRAARAGHEAPAERRLILPDPGRSPERISYAMTDQTQTPEAVDFFRGDSEELLIDPFSYFAELRDKCPVLREPHHDVVMVTGYDEARAVYQDSATFSSANSVSGPFPGFPVPLEGDDVTDLIEEYRDQLPLSDQIIVFDPPKHTDHRALMFRLLTPKRLRENEDLMWQLANNQFERFLADGKVEFISAYAAPFTLMVIADLLGVPEEDKEGFRQDLSRRGGRSTVGSTEAAMEQSPLEVLYTRFSNYIIERRANPRGDVLSGLANATFPDGTVPDPGDTARVAVNIFAAGQETTVRLLGAAFQILGERPDIQQALRDDRSLIPNFVEECLRLESPVKGDFRLSRTPTTVGGVDVSAGSCVMVLERCGQPGPARIRAAGRHRHQPEERPPPHRLRPRPAHLPGRAAGPRRGRRDDLRGRST